MVRINGKKKTIFWLIIILCVVIWIELVMVVKFFTKEFLKNTIEEDALAHSYYKELILANESKIKQTKETLPQIPVETPEMTAEKPHVNSMQEKTEEYIPVQNQRNEAKQTVSSRASTPKVIQQTEIIEEKPVTEEIQEPDKTNTVEPTYSGYDAIGKIEIPKTGVNLPILAKQTVGGMEIASCMIYTTGELNKSGKTLILGHNYRNGKLFSNNNKLQVGDRIIITSIDGSRVEYEIYNKIVTNPEDASFLRDSGELEIVLSSCTDDNVNRVVLMARKI